MQSTQQAVAQDIQVAYNLPEAPTITMDTAGQPTITVTVNSFIVLWHDVWFEQTTCQYDVIGTQPFLTRHQGLNRRLIFWVGKIKLFSDEMTTKYKLKWN